MAGIVTPRIVVAKPIPKSTQSGKGKNNEKDLVLGSADPIAPRAGFPFKSPVNVRIKV